MSTGIIAAQSTDTQYIIFFLNVSNRDNKRRFRSINTVVENFARCQTKLLVHACIIGLLALTRSCAWIGRVWEQNNYLPSPIPWFQAGVDLCTASWLATRLEYGCESTRFENRAFLVVGRFSIDTPFTNKANSRYWTIYLSEKWFCFLKGVVTKNRTLSKPSFQVRGLSKRKPVCLSYLYLFVCSATRRVPSFVEAYLCYAHICTFLPVLSLHYPNPLPWHWIEACHHQEN